MQAREQKIGDHLVVFPQGHLDRVSAAAFEHQLVLRIESGQRSVLVDCTGLRLATSNGLRALWTACSALRERGGRMALCGLDAALAERLRLSGLLRYLPAFASQEDALRALDRAAEA